MPEHLETLVQAGMDKIENEGVLVPSLPTTEAAAAANGTNGENGTDGGSGTNGETSGLERIRGPVPVSRVQQFWPTAPPEGQPGGSPCKSFIQLTVHTVCRGRAVKARREMGLR